MPETGRHTLPGSSATLCFNKEEFMKEDFNVDHFVVECRRRVVLETLRDDLSVYLKILQSAMIELINKDYADFVNLSTNLVGVDKAINSLTTPLGHLREEVMKVRTAMDEAIIDVEAKLNQQTAIREKKASLQRMMDITQSVNKMETLLGIQAPPSGERSSHYTGELTGQLIERVATEFNKLQFYVNKSRGVPLVEHVKPRIANITSTLQLSLEGSFGEGLETNNTHMLRQCLRTYATIDKMRDAESLFRHHIVKPYMEAVVTEEYIMQNPLGLKGMYQKVLEFIPKHCQKLNEALVKGGEVVRGYDFLVNAVWPEIVANIEARTPSMFAPGNPNVFREKYTISLEFVCSFERQCGSQASVKRLRSHPSYNSFMTKWSLPVYFQIRFQEIAGAFESALANPFTLPSTEKEVFQLSATEVVWSSLHRCWQPDVYLSPLCHRFWKLTLQVLSRYTVWVQEVHDTQLKVAPGGGDAEPVAKPITGSGEPSLAETCPQTPTLITMAQVVCLITDSRTLAKKVPEFYQAVVVPNLVQLGDQDTSFLSESLKDSTRALTAALPQFGDHIVDEITGQCAVHLRLVSDTPRLYRRTNREVPSKPSTYVANLLKPLLTFLTDHQRELPDDLRTDWVLSILANLTEQYYQTTSDVLTSVRKMEESLKRLKRKGSRAGVGGGMSDDDKIRLQLLIDVQNYGQQIGETGVNSSDVDVYQRLLELVETAANGAASM